MPANWDPPLYWNTNVSSSANVTYTGSSVYVMPSTYQVVQPITPSPLMPSLRERTALEWLHDEVEATCAMGRLAA